jgi:hypothetical protein
MMSQLPPLVVDAVAVYETPEDPVTATVWSSGKAPPGCIENWIDVGVAVNEPPDGFVPIMIEKFEVDER